MDSIAGRDVVPAARAHGRGRRRRPGARRRPHRRARPDRRPGAAPPPRPPLARRALRRWLADGGYPPDAATVARVLAVARGEHRACEIAGGRRVERHAQRLRIVPSGPLVSNDGMSSTAARREPGHADGHPTPRPMGARHHAPQLHVDPQGQAGDLRAPRRLRREPPPRPPPGGDHLDPRERLRLRDLDHPGAAQPPQLRRARRHRRATDRSTARSSRPG